MDLRELGSMGGFFALRTSADTAHGPGGTGEPPADGPPEQASTGGAEPVPPAGSAPLSRLYAGGLDPLTRRVDLVAARHSPPERRVAASIAQLGLAARLWSIGLGCAALHGRVPELDPERLYWSPGSGTPDDLWFALPPGGPRTLPATADALRAVIEDTHLAPFGDAVRRDTRISPRLLRGNEGSALAGAVRQIDTWAREHGRTAVAENARALAAALFAAPRLSGTVRGPAMRRTSCCLYYRAPRGGLCGDCVFDRPPAHGGRRA
ncbi:(2Fe-2S)-binding protein [Streptomyces clavuligerus]|uniref:(2Fe-2S)-binding protein n=1 Tax=Streptomyces clavuligerus TaxID=1901 RepID=UPI000A3E7ECB|nr:(2Fe-2S)-binding protein [Streptomyces clavuligerus]